MSEHTPSAEHQYSEHKYLAQQLEVAKQKLAEINKRIQQQGRWSKLLGGKIEGGDIHTNVKEKVQWLQDKYDENLRISEEHADEYIAEAQETMGQWKPYAEEQTRLAEEIGADPVILEPNDYIKSYDELKYRTPDEFKDRKGELAGIRDFFKPRLSEPIKEHGLESRDNVRLPRMEIGTDAQTAITKAQEKGFTKIIRIKQDTKITSESLRNIHREYQVVKTDKVYIPVSDETATLLDHAGDMGEDITLYQGSGMKDWPTMAGILEYNYQIMSLEEVEKEMDSQELKLTYDEVNLGTDQTTLAEISFEGEDGDALYKKALQHFIGLEMGEKPTIAQNVRVTIGGREISWQEFEEEVAGR